VQGGVRREGSFIQCTGFRFRGFDTADDD
jgi:hypothetical protein